MAPGNPQLTDADNGVLFDLKPDGTREAISWTLAGSMDGFLSLDRDGNGQIDSGKELFGSVTVQPPTDRRNGFNALSVFDENRDRLIQNSTSCNHFKMHCDCDLWSR